MIKFDLNILLLVFRKSLFVLTTTVFVTGSISAEEQTTAGNTSALEEIVVTARKVEESLQETPVSITAFTFGDMEKLSLNDLKDIGSFTPNMNFTNSSIAGPSAGQVYIRGVGQFDFSVATDPGVGMYLDGVYLGRTIGGILDLVDLERVEILRGPQGSLYGKNTIGGAINIVSAKPTGEFGGDLKLTTGRFNRIDVQGSVDIPILEDRLAGRISISSRNRDGYGYRLSDGKEMGDIDSQSGRFLLQWDAADNLSFLFSADGTRQRSGGAVRSLIATAQTPLMQLYNTFAGPYDDRFLTGNPFTTFGTDRLKNDLDVWGTSLTIDWKVNDLSVKSITAYRDLESAFAADIDHSPHSVGDEFDQMEQDQFSQEIQLGGIAFDNRLNWLAGVYYLKERANMLFDIKIMSELLPAIGLDIDTFIGNDISTDSYAVFGHATYDLTDQLSFSAGLRYTYEEKDFTVFNRSQNLGLVVVPPTDMSDDWDALSPKVGLDYQWNPDLMVYGSVARGFKSGGFNPRPFNPGDVAAYDPEYVWTYEAGFKSQWFNDRLRVNTSFFYNDYKDIQVTVIGGSPTGALLTFIENAAQAEVKGAELEIVTKPIDALELSAGVGYIDAEFTETELGSTTTVNSKFIETPEWSLNLSGAYSFPLLNLGTLTARGDYVYQSKVYRDGANSPQLTQDGYGLANARLTFESTNSQWQVALFVTNLTDKDYLSGAGATVLDSIGLVEGQFGRPREWGLMFQVQF